MRAAFCQPGLGLACGKEPQRVAKYRPILQRFYSVCAASQTSAFWLVRQAPPVSSSMSAITVVSAVLVLMLATASGRREVASMRASSRVLLANAQSNGQAAFGFGRSEFSVIHASTLAGAPLCVDWSPFVRICERGCICAFLYLPLADCIDSEHLYQRLSRLVR